MLWNNLSFEAKTAQSLSDFKHKTCLLAFHAFYWIVLIPCNILFILNTYILSVMFLSRPTWKPAFVVWLA